MTPVRFVALGDSLTQGVGDPVGDGWRGWAALLAPSLAETPDAVEFTNLAVSGAQTRDVLERQTPAALELRPDLVSVVIGVNDTLRRTFDIRAVAARLDEVYAAFTREGAILLTACLPDPGAMLGLPSALARPLARRQRAVNTVVHALSERYRAVHLDAVDGAWITDRSLWSADRLHPGERGHRQLAVRFHALLTEAGRATGQPPSPEPEFSAPTRAASLLWLATAGTAWVARRCKDLLPQLLRLAADELHHRARGTSARLDLSASAAVSEALAALSQAPDQVAEAQRRPAVTQPTGTPAPARTGRRPDTNREPATVGRACAAVVPDQVGEAVSAGSVGMAGVAAGADPAGDVRVGMVRAAVVADPVGEVVSMGTVCAVAGVDQVGEAVSAGRVRAAEVPDLVGEAVSAGSVGMAGVAAGADPAGDVRVGMVRAAMVADPVGEVVSMGTVCAVAGLDQAGDVVSAGRVRAAVVADPVGDAMTGVTAGAVTVTDPVGEATAPGSAREAVRAQAVRTTVAAG